MLKSKLRFAMLVCVLGLLPGAPGAAEQARSQFGNIAIPDPAKPLSADKCVEPVEIMRRDHMEFLLHQRDETVIDGERGSKYSLVGCMNCHNPAGADGKVVRYEDPQHFCAECHAYASVRIDCFECHADRGLLQSQQGRLDMHAPAWKASAAVPPTSTLQRRLGTVDGD
ncbi:MAG: hypothetical protein OEN02_01630 [Gammaproteobacteria bacterium]|nr:hypothetical protein [Gammaproteobacteria bacterium]MDH3535414.1 hypothetical protein [Gammaproteobacteria bacterium]